MRDGHRPPQGLSTSSGTRRMHHGRQLGGRLRTVRAALTPAEWARLRGMTLFILALNVLRLGHLRLRDQPHHFRYTGLGVGPRA